MQFIGPIFSPPLAEGGEPVLLPPPIEARLLPLVGAVRTFSGPLYQSALVEPITPVPAPPPPCPPSSVANIAQLVSMSGKDGLSIYVKSVECFWQYVSSGVEFVVDHITVEVTADGGNSRWVRGDEPSLIWRTAVAHVYIDSVSGNDENQGIYYDVNPPPSPAAIKTGAELARRWGRGTVTSEVTSSETIIHLKNAIPVSSGDTLTVTWTAGANSFFRILGENTATLHAGAMDATGGFTQWNPSAPGGGTPTIIKDTTSGVSWSALIGKRIHFPRVDSYSVVLKDLGGGMARVAVPQSASESNFELVPTLAFPVSGDTYVVDEPVHVTFGEIDVDLEVTPNGIFGLFSQINIADVTIETAPGDTPFVFVIGANSYLIPIVFYHCMLDGSYLNSTDAEFVTFLCCRAYLVREASVSGAGTSGGLAFFGGALIFPGFTSINNVSGGLGDAGVLDYYVCIQDGYVEVHGGSNIRSISVFDAPVTSDNPEGHAILIGASGHHSTNGTVVIADRAGYPIFGSGNAGTGIFVGAACHSIWELLPNIYGTGPFPQFQLGSGGKARFFNETSGVYSSAIAETWSNLAAAQPNGFGGRAHNLTDDSHFLLTI
jgi:hypothetical protein